MFDDEDLMMDYREATDDYADEVERHHKALSEISGRRYAALVALSNRGRTHQEIGTMLGLDTGHVGHLIARGRRREREK